MLFTSIEFLLFFFPAVFSIYYLLPARTKNYWLLITSLFFYGWGEPLFVFVMIGSILMNHRFALEIENLRDHPEKQKSILVLAVSVNLCILAIFKYLNFITVTLHSVFPQTKSLFPSTSIVLPIGISFFTFQSLSYVIDVYRGIPAQKSLFSVGLYISLFPQLIAGPIVRYTTIMDQISDRSINLKKTSDGLIRFFEGFNKKMILANTLSSVADQAFLGSEISVGMAWLGALCYSLQIYFDFSGYSDMAIGLGKMLGFEFLENFNYPYISKTVTEFWRRWHISLGTWFRDYVYFPMGGSRVKSKWQLVWNLLVVWTLTGIWHGANWTFITWGILYGIVIIVEKLLDVPKRLDHISLPLQCLYQALTLFLVMSGWVIFRANNLAHAINYLKTMIGMNGSAIFDRDFVFYFREYMIYIIFGCLCSTPVFRNLRRRMAYVSPALETITYSTHYIFQLILFVISFSFLIMNAHNPFIYFNF